MYQSRFLLFFILITSFAFGSGGWISGGGELLKDSHNPWFLNNVNEVFYCVKFSNSNFGENQKNVENQLKSGIDFWKSEFSYAIAPEYKGLGKLKIANQNFLKVDCNDVRVDIKFQFGVLDKAQKPYLKQPNKYAAVTVRTHYDEDQAEQQVEQEGEHGAVAVQTRCRAVSSRSRSLMPANGASTPPRP